MKEPEIINDKETYLRDKKDESVEERNDKSDASMSGERELNEQMKKEYQGDKQWEKTQKLNEEEKKREQGSIANKTKV